MNKPKSTTGKDAIANVWQAMDSVRDASLILKAKGKSTLYLDAAWHQLEAIAIELAYQDEQ